MMALSKDGILAAVDRETVEVEVPEWGGTVLLRPMAAGDLDSVPEATVGKLIALSVVDEAGEPLFAEEDIPALEKKSAAAVNRLMERVVEINGLDVDDVAGN